MVNVITLDNSLKVYLLKGSNDKAYDLWQEIEKNSTHVALTSSWEWTRTWIEVFGDMIPHWFAVCEYEGVPVGISLITKQTGRPLPVPVRAFHLGTAGEPYRDWISASGNAILVDERYRGEFLRGIADIMRRSFKWDELVFEHYLQQDAEVAAKAFRSVGLQAQVDQEACPTFDLEGARNSGKDILSSLSHDLRYSIRRAIKGLGNDLYGEWAESSEQARSRR